MTGSELTAEARLLLLRWKLSLSWEAPDICRCLLSWTESDAEKESTSTGLSDTWINAANASSPQTQLDSAILKPFKRSMSFYHGSCSDWWSDSTYLYLPSQTSSGARDARYWSPKTSMRWLLTWSPNDGWNAAKNVTVGVESTCFYHAWSFLSSLWGRSCCSAVLWPSLNLHHSYFVLIRQWYHILRRQHFFLRLFLPWYQSVKHDIVQLCRAGTIC